MKKLNKVLAILCTSAVAVSVGAFAGCTKPDDGGTHTHSYNYTKVDDTNHKGECKVDGCDAPEITEAHNWGTDNKCEKCDAVKATVTKVEITGATEAKVGEEVQLTATVTGTGNPAKTVKWEKVSGEGAVSADGKVTATAAGEVKVKATSTVDDTKSAEHTVVFEAVEVNLTLAQNYVVLEDKYVDNEDTEDLTSAEIEVTYNGSGEVEAISKTPEIATAVYSEGILTVNAVKTGKAVIEVTDGDKKTELTVEVATFGLNYGRFMATVGDNQVPQLRVSDSDMRTDTNIYIPGSFYSIDDEAYLPVTEIAEGGFTVKQGKDFVGKTNITSVYTGDNVVIVQQDAFNNDSELKTVTIGANLRVLSHRNFQNCSKLDTINWAENGVVQEIGQSCFLGTAVVDVVLPETITKLNSSIFNGCSELRSIKILGDATIIYGGSFQCCLKLREVWLPATITTIESLAFYFADAENGWAEITVEEATIHFAGTREQWDNLRDNGIGDSGNTLFNSNTKNLIVICADDAAE